MSKLKTLDLVANFTVELSGDWMVAYWVGGAMGISLLLLRVGVVESGVFKNLTEDHHVQRGNFLTFFTNKIRFVKYMKCIAIGLPSWFCIGILAMLGNEIGEAHQIPGGIKPGMAIMWAYVGISAGDFLSGFISHFLKSRKKAILGMMIFTMVICGLVLFGPVKSQETYYMYCIWLGFGSGYWAMFVTVAAEQFGTNVRATATTTIPNMVRGMVIVMTLMYDYFTEQIASIYSAAMVGVLIFAVALYATITIAETHHKDLDFIEA